jgi:hypothetical protein
MRRNWRLSLSRSSFNLPKSDVYQRRRFVKIVGWSSIYILPTHYILLLSPILGFWGLLLRLKMVGYAGPSYPPALTAAIYPVLVDEGCSESVQQPLQTVYATYLSAARCKD